MKDQYDNPVPGVAVTFAVAAGGGSVTGATATSNAQGIATVGGWTLGPTAGPQSLSASAPGLGAVTFSVVARAAAPSRIDFVAAPPATAAGGALLPAIVVQLEDAHGNAVTQAGVDVTASLASDEGTLHGTTTVATDGQGRATFDDLRIDGSPGDYALSFTAAGLAPPPQAPIALSAGAPTTITIIAGDDQEIPAGAAAPIAPSVRVTDAVGNPVAGVEVIFGLQSGEASPAVAFRTTDANGIATLETWTVGTRVGTVTMTAAITGVPGVVFSATIVPAAPAVVTKVAGDAQNALIGSPVAVAPAVRVTDAYGNVVSGLTVTFTVIAGGGSVTGGTPTTGENGVATVGSWTLGGTPGEQSLRAFAGPAGGVVFTATAMTAVASKLAFVVPPPDVARVGVKLPTMVVQLQDAAGNAVASPGVRVTVAIVGGNELRGDLTVETDAEGRATFDDVTIYGIEQLGRLQFTAPGLTGLQKDIRIDFSPLGSLSVPPTGR